MVDDNRGNDVPAVDVLSDWAESYGLSHPVASDPSGRDALRYVTYGFPTYVLIDREMVISNPDMFPFDDRAVERLLDE